MGNLSRWISETWPLGVRGRMEGLQQEGKKGEARQKTEKEDQETIQKALTKAREEWKKQEEEERRKETQEKQETKRKEKEEFKKKQREKEVEDRRREKEEQEKMEEMMRQKEQREVEERKRQTKKQEAASKETSGRYRCIRMVVWELLLRLLFIFILRKHIILIFYKKLK